MDSSICIYRCIIRGFCTHNQALNNIVSLTFFNLLKLIDFMYHQFNIHKFCILLTQCIYVRINNQQDASRIQNFLFCHKNLHVSGIFCTHHQELSAVYMAVGMFHAGYVATRETVQDKRSNMVQQSMQRRAAAT
jgi:hypothetical protein